jgi:hypothetical protein
MISIDPVSRIVKFSSVSSITIFIPENFGADVTRIFYIGLKGDFGTQVGFSSIAHFADYLHCR